jgi:hypothetical protein
MIKQIEFPYRKWTFEVYDSNKDIKTVTLSLPEKIKVVKIYTYIIETN